MIRGRLIVRRIRGKSMLPTLKPGQVVLGWTHPRRLSPGHIIVFKHEGLEKIKRVQAIRGQELFVQGDLADFSSDSRDFGWLERGCVIARVWWPRHR